MSFLKNKKIVVTAFVFLFVVITGFKFLNDKFVIGMQHPESAYFNGRYIFVSNIGSSPMSKNKDGFITKLDRYGNILEYKFLDNLQAPKGIWIYGNLMYIADLDRVCTANIDTKKTKCIEIKGSEFLNDIIYFDKKIYVTDTMTNNVYVISGKKVDVFFHKPDFSPNGIAFSKKLNAFVVVSFNKPVVNIISLSGKLIKSIYLKGFSGFDGLVIKKGEVFISDYRTGEILKTNLQFKKVYVIKEFKTPAADIFVYDNKLIAPLLEADKVYIGDIKQ